ncbi:glycolate oxidase FAD binding subunit [Bacillus mesophilus]|uniref:FAD-binding oxidoreductase n=1 Tax=Bacillus mesophilus TaxID=1808955 RepID=A0A6M0Q8E8_9BACI|nr:FAD-binding oxidoreductase [Bacillus mesophilus]MBM7661997.1 glycolate oxidase FAD binding subunit [Bacillus mesophilus]NEY72646.1 FAD-binding oxidoreductase [Bacillus mesophilus]
MMVTECLTELKTFISEAKISEKNDKHPLGNGGAVTVFPTTEEEISNVLKFANQHKLSISIMGGGTKRGFGGVIENADLLLSLSHYRGVVEHTIGDMTLTVKAGTPFGEIQKYLAQFNQKISLDPSWPERSTIGGIIASNESGPKRLGYGSARDAVIGLRTVYADGSIIRSGGKVVKNVAGYDMNKLFIGSMGTLAVVSEITLKLRPITKDENLVLVSFTHEDFDLIKSFVIELLDTTLEPISLELLNPSLTSRLIDHNRFTLAISFEDVESSVQYQVSQISKMIPVGTELLVLQKEEAANFWSTFYSIGPDPYSFEVQDTKASLKIGVVNLDVIHILRKCQTLEDVNNVSIEAHGGLGHGLCFVHINGAELDVLSAIHQLRELAKSYGGYAIVKHLPYHLRKTTNIWGDLPSYFFLIKSIKEKMDPNHVLNHKRFVGGL